MIICLIYSHWWIFCQKNIFSTMGFQFQIFGGIYCQDLHLWVKKLSKFALFWDMQWMQTTNYLMTTNSYMRWHSTAFDLWLHSHPKKDLDSRGHKNWSCMQSKWFALFNYSLLYQILLRTKHNFAHVLIP